MKSTTICCGDDTVDRQELNERAARVAQGLKAEGVGPGDRVALLMRNSVGFLEVSLGGGRLGAYLVAVNWHLRPPEIEVILDDADPAALFVDADLVESLPASWQGRVPTHVFGAGYDAWRDGLTPLADPPLTAPGTIIYTSGTTGRPKGVQRELPASEADREAMLAVRRRLYRLEPDSRVLVPGPLYHALSNQVAMLAAREAQAVFVSPRFDPEDFLATVQRERITVAVVAPIMFARMLKLPEAVRARYDVSSLKWALHAGSHCAPDVKRRMIDWFGPILADYYGATETGPLTLCDSQEWLARPGTSGRAMPEAILKVVDEAGRELPAGQPGEVVGRLKPYPDFTYRNDPQKRAASAVGDLIAVGDVGYLDEEGYLFLCDRAKDMIVSGAVNIYPAEIEAALSTLPGVDDCAVIGVPDEEFGESVCALVVGEDIDGERLRAQLKPLIAGYKIPRRFIAVPTLNRDVLGKLRKRELRERYAHLLTTPVPQP